ncbi:hypothetical protein [Myxococcus xanthus]|uniref:hypothetical protein n=1 Tax=Myxococcus xanthus TaxID=34 RepID=UPI00112C845C|nr:hypothetical protein [Myxococcus xanthus]
MRGTWLGSADLADSYNDFSNAIKEGLSPEEAAKTRTFTGHMANKRGYSQFKVIELNEVEKRVVVEFRK